jgi:2-keto-3-deoxy-L-rhamnonate aldolase RhmA
MEMGATIMAVGSDVAVLRDGTKALRERYRPS